MTREIWPNTTNNISGSKNLGNSIARLILNFLDLKLEAHLDLVTASCLRDKKQSRQKRNLRHSRKNTRRGNGSHKTKRFAPHPARVDALRALFFFSTRCAQLASLLASLPVSPTRRLLKPRLGRPAAPLFNVGHIGRRRVQLVRIPCCFQKKKKKKA